LKNGQEIKEIAHKAIDIEAAAIGNLKNYIDDDFLNAVDRIFKMKGRVIVTGIGKSAIIAQKIVATFNSTGTPAAFMHAADAIHGDLGTIQKDDVVICISKSGNTPEIKVLVPLLKQSENLLIGMVGDLNSVLAKQADLVLNTTVDIEACPNNLAPTSSTTAQMVMGDALAVCLLEAREFSSADFAKYHPGGSLGKRLYLKAGDIAAHNEKPEVTADSSVQDVLLEITRNRLGAAVVIENENICGIITDGDIRRMMEHHATLEGLTARDIMGKYPKTIEKDALAVESLELMRSNNISQVVVLEQGKYAGMVHLHDLLKEGIV